MSAAINEEVVKQAVKEAIKEELAPLFVEREQHYLDHQFIGSVRKFNDRVKGEACKTATHITMIAAASLIVWGLIHWIKAAFGLGPAMPK